MKLSILYPATTGRNFDEILRVVDSLQLTATKLVATPVDWQYCFPLFADLILQQNGDDCVVVPTIDDNEAKKLFGEKINTVELPSGKRYLRMVEHPK
ncbi:unnamed protein product [Wuchereria bancrofti]|uniref:Peroxiredoxin C-terminal domain-containing protein n=1 Tax=Wuchereria bancrofti TaxID=6293 RepID=A0A3P7E9T6_WUCBA|nr:unnamed protein product [Wuchereria bancrofti]